MSDDIMDFVEAAGNFDIKPVKHKVPQAIRDKVFRKGEEDEEETTPGQLSQYALHRDGYMPVTPTVKTLPTGCYDINADQTGIYVSPIPPPQGLLLELPDMRSQDVINVVERFWDSEADYKDGNDYVKGGATFKSGVLIWGEPGTGKSCTIKIVAKKIIERGGTVFYSSMQPELTNVFLNNFSKVEPDRKCVVVLEDLDSLIQVYGENGYLEMLDSAKTINNVLFIATTNYPDRLDPRIYNRPGRFSNVIKVGLPTPKARKAFLEAILKRHDDVPYIVENTNGFSIDHLSALVNATYREGKDLKEELARLRKLFKVPKIEEPAMGIGIGNGVEE